MIIIYSGNRLICSLTFINIMMIPGSPVVKVLIVMPNNFTEGCIAHLTMISVSIISTNVAEIRV